MRRPQVAPQHGGGPGIHIGAALDQHDQVVLTHQAAHRGEVDGRHEGDAQIRRLFVIWLDLPANLHLFPIQNSTYRIRDSCCQEHQMGNYSLDQDFSI